MFFLSCVCYAFVRVCLYVPCGHLLGMGLTPWLSYVVSNCEFNTFPLVPWVRCGTRLYRFLIFAPLVTLNALYWYQIVALSSAVVEVQEIFSLHGSLLTIAMYHHGETL